MKIGVIGASRSEICGVRTYSRVLERELAVFGVVCDHRWWEGRVDASLRDLLGFASGWATAEARGLADRGADLILWHYSIFTLAHRGVPILVPLLCRALRAAGVPVVTFLHEFAHPWGSNGMRGALWAASQRSVLPLTMGISRGVVVTTESRDRWIASRPWLPRRERLLVPVLSMLGPRAELDPRRVTASSDVAMVSYSTEEVDLELVLRAFLQVRAASPSSRLLLVGSPGSQSPVGRAWSDAARRARCEDAICFTELLSEGEMAAAVDAAAVVLFANREGASGRKTTLALSLARAKAIVAIDGPHALQSLVREAAAWIVKPDASAISGALLRLLSDPSERASQEARAACFHERHQSPERVIPRFVEFFGRIAGDAPELRASLAGVRRDVRG